MRQRGCMEALCQCQLRYQVFLNGIFSRKVDLHRTQFNQIFIKKEKKKNLRETYKKALCFMKSYSKQYLIEKVFKRLQKIKNKQFNSNEIFILFKFFYRNNCEIFYARI